jgi:hypothetical protein
MIETHEKLSNFVGWVERSLRNPTIIYETIIPSIQGIRSSSYYLGTNSSSFLTQEGICLDLFFCKTNMFIKKILPPYPSDYLSMDILCLSDVHC